MKSSLAINALILICVALLGYALTTYFDNRTPPAAAQPEAPALEIDDSLKSPDFAFTTTDGTQHNLREFEGKIVLLNFWASWCPPCVKEFPAFLEVAESNKDEVVFIALSSDTEEQAMMDFVHKLEQQEHLKQSTENVLIALDTENIAQQTFSTYRLPETLIIDHNNNIRDKLIGADWTIEGLQNQINKLKSEQ